MKNLLNLLLFILLFAFSSYAKAQNGAIFLSYEDFKNKKYTTIDVSKLKLHYSNRDVIGVRSEAKLKGVDYWGICYMNLLYRQTEKNNEIIKVIAIGPLVLYKKSIAVQHGNISDNSVRSEGTIYFISKTLNSEIYSLAHRDAMELLRELANTDAAFKDLVSYIDKRSKVSGKMVDLGSTIQYYLEEAKGRVNLESLLPDIN